MKILSILPESIAGRLIISGLIEGFKSNNVEIDVIDELKISVEKEFKLLNISEYDYLLSYDYTAIKLNKDYSLNLKTLNYFSDVIESDYSGRSWEKYYNELFDSNTYVFYWDRVLYETLKGKMPNIYYLPLSINTSIYKNLYLEKEYDIMFAGRLTFENRLNKLLMIEEKFSDKRIAIYSYRQHFDQVLELIDESKREKFEKFYKGFIETEEEMAIAINKSHMVVNFTSQGVSSLNYRLFETIACEALLLTDYRSELDELFTPGKDVIYYKNDEALLEQIGDYFSDPEKYESIIKAGRSRVEKDFNTKEMARKIISWLKSEDKNIIIGASGTSYSGWISTNINTLNLLKPSEWDAFCEKDSVNIFLAEHVWEHLSKEEGITAAKTCYNFLKKGGRLRAAVPDGYHPDVNYIEWVKPRGCGPGSDDHKILYNYKSFKKIFESVGFKVLLLEYFDENHKFHYNNWDPKDGMIIRSKRFDPRNQEKDLKYTSIIVDAFKL